MQESNRRCLHVLMFDPYDFFFFFFFFLGGGGGGAWGGGGGAGGLPDLLYHISTGRRVENTYLITT